MGRIKFSNSSIKTLQRCEQKYDYKYIRLLEPKQSPRPLKLGSWVHLLIDAKHKVGGWKKAHRQQTLEFNQLLPEEKEYYGDLPTQTETIMRGYDWNYRDDGKEWQFEGSEVPVMVDVGRNFTYVGTLDRLGRNQDGLWIWDTKTFRGKKPTMDYRTTDPQSSLYLWAYPLVSGIKPVGFVFDYIRTKVPSIPKINKDGSVSKAKVDTNWYTYRKFLKDNGFDAANFRPQLAAARARDRDFYDRIMVPKPTAVIRSLLEDIKELLPRIADLHRGRRPTRNLTYLCERDCPYHLICLTELVGGDPSYIIKHNFTEYNWEEYRGNDEDEADDEQDRQDA